MAGIGDDIKDVLQELGTPFTIYHVNGDSVTGEYLDYEHYFDASTEFRRQFCYSGDFQFDSVIVTGDLISFDSKYFLMMNVRKSIFEGLAVDHSNYFVQCNAKGRLSHKTTARDSGTYKSTVTWTTLHDDVYAVQSEHEPTFEEEKVMDLVTNEFALYCQAYTDVHEGDRWYPDNTDLTEFYKIVSVSKYRFPGMLVCRLEEDSRE